MINAFKFNRIADIPNTGPESLIVSFSDIHGYLDEARSALLTIGETNRFDPIVTADDEGRLHWAGNNYVPVFNGDLIDRGPENKTTIKLALRLLSEAPPGRVQYLLGNHEMAILLPKRLRWPGTYSQQLTPQQRWHFISLIISGAVRSAFAGHQYTYSHAGDINSINVPAVNITTRKAARELAESIEQGPKQYAEQQMKIPNRYEQVFGLDGPRGRGKEAGLLWMDFKHMTTTAPPQIVGHTKQNTPTRRRNVVCENVIRQNQDHDGGEAVLIESDTDLVAVIRQSDGSVAVEHI